MSAFTVQELLTARQRETIVIAFGGSVRVQGAVASVRKSGSLVFVEVQDGSCLATLQLVVEKKNTDAFAAAQTATFKCTISAEGKYVLGGNSKASKPEVNCTAFRVVGRTGENFPLVKTADMSMDFLRQVRVSSLTFFMRYTVPTSACPHQHLLLSQQDPKRAAVGHARVMTCTMRAS